MTVATAQYILVSLFFIVFQAAPFHLIPGVANSPAMTLTLSVHCGLLWGRAGGLLFGAAMGLIDDLLRCGTVGPAVLSWGLAGFITGALRESYISGELIVRILLVIAATLMDLFIQGAFTMMIAHSGARDAALAAMGPQVLVNTGFAAVAMPLLGILDTWVAQKSSLLEKRRRTQSFLKGMGAKE